MDNICAYSFQKQHRKEAAIFVNNNNLFQAFGSNFRYLTNVIKTHFFKIIFQYFHFTLDLNDLKIPKIKIKIQFLNKLN